MSNASFLPYILDVIIILIVAIFIFLSAKKGFVRTLIEVVGFIAAIVIAFTVSTPVSNFIYNSFIEPAVVKTVENAAAETASSATNAVDAVWVKMPTFITESSFFNLSKTNITSTVQTQTESGGIELAQTISESFVKPIATKLLSVLISVILVIALLFVVKILAKLINKLFTFSIVGDLNKTLGGVLGFFKGVAMAVVFCLIISLIISFTKNGFLIFTYETINKSYIFKFLIELSPFI